MAAPTDPVATEVIPGRVWLGSAQAVADGTTLSSLGITHILCCAAEFADQPYPSSNITRHTLPLLDAAGIRAARSKGLKIPSPKAHAAEIVEGARIVLSWLEAFPGARILVHCAEGRSRSACVIVALHLLREGGQGNASKELLRLQRLRPSVRPLGGLQRLIEMAVAATIVY